MLPKYLKYSTVYSRFWCIIIVTGDDVMRYAARNRSNLVTERRRLTELKVICATAGEWEKPMQHRCGLTSIRRNQQRKFETTVLKWMFTKVQNS